jgi:hypothetical protein
MATLLKVLNNLADIKSAGGVALRVRTQDRAGRSPSPRRRQGARAMITVEGASLPPFPSFPGRGRAAERAHRRVRLVYAGKALARDGKRVLMR